MASKYSSIDNSPTKQKYSFPKAERFPKISIYGAMSFYNIPTFKNERATSFGYGSRYNFTKKNSENTPACYDFSYGVESNQPYAPKYTFGVSRENMKNNLLDKSTPGPGKYYSRIKTLGNDSPKYSMKGKYKNSLYPRSDSPGPAAYDPHTQMPANGVFSIAGFKNVKSYDFSKGIRDRFDYKVDRTPGPAEYKNNKSLFGNIYDSRFRSTQGIGMTFRHEKKDRDNYPGPGAYERYGDFYKYNERYLYDNINKKSSQKDSFKTPKKEKKNDDVNNKSIEENENEKKSVKDKENVNEKENEKDNENENEHEH